MPILTPEQKRRGIVALGYDPDKVDYDEELQVIIPKVQEQPTVTTSTNSTFSPLLQQQEQVTPTDEPTPLGSAGRQFVSGLPAAAGGIGAGALATAGLGVLAVAGAPVSLPIATGVVLTSALLGGGAADWLKRKIIPQSWQETLEKDVQVNPKSSMFGNVMASAPFLKPDIRAVKEAVTGLRNISTGIRPSPQQIGNTLNVGVGAGVGAAQAAVEDLEQDQPINIGKMLASSAANALLNNPTRLGRKLGLAPNIYTPRELTRGYDPTTTARPTVVRDEVPLAPVNEFKKPTALEQFKFDTGANDEPAASPFSTKQPGKEDAYVREYKELIPAAEQYAPELLVKSDVSTEAPEGYKWKVGLEETEIRRILDEKVFGDEIPHDTKYRADVEESQRIYEQDIQKTKRAADYQKAVSELQQQEARQLELQTSEAQTKAQKLATENDALERELVSTKPLTPNQLRLTVGEGKVVSPETMGGKFDKTTTARPLPVEEPVVSKLSDEPTTALSADESVSDLQAREIESRLTGERSKPKYQERPTTDIPQTEDRLSKVPAWVNNFFTRLGSKFRNVDVTTTREKLSTPEGAEANAEVLVDILNKSAAKINSDKPDTWPHEIGHAWLEYLRNSNHKPDQRIARKLAESIQNNPEFISTNKRRVAEGKPAWDAEEFLMDASGRRTIEQITKKDYNAFKDFWSYVKTSAGKGNTKDVARVFANKLRFDAPYEKPTGDTSNVKAGVKNIRQQERKDDKTLNASKMSEADWNNYIDARERLHKFTERPSSIDDIPNYQNIVKTLQFFHNKYNFPGIEETIGASSDAMNSAIEKSAKVNERYVGSAFQEDPYEIMRHAAAVDKQLTDMWAGVGKQGPEHIIRNQERSNDPIKFIPDTFWGRLGFKQDVNIPKNQLFSKLRNTLDADSMMWKLIDTPEFKDSFKNKSSVTLNDVKNWVDNNGPQVEIKILGAESADPIVKEYNKLHHEWLDSHVDKYTIQNFLKAEKKLADAETNANADALAEAYANANAFAYAEAYAYANADALAEAYAVYRNRFKNSKSIQEYKNVSEQIYNEIKQKIQDNLVKFSEKWGENFTRMYDLHQKLPKETQTNDQSNWSNISDKPESKMEGYVEIAVTKPFGTSKQIARKDEIRMNHEYSNTPEGTAEFNALDKPQFSSSHDFPPNTLGWVRGYMETLPDGRKVFKIIEVQSDWAAKVKRDVENDPHGPGGKSPIDDPLLSQYERLAVKAAIEHARKQGADSIAVVDAETAMMIEGHDSRAQLVRPYKITSFKYNFPDIKNTHGADWRQGKYAEITPQQSNSFVVRIDRPEKNLFKNIAIARAAKDYIESGFLIKEESGMRQHYDPRYFLSGRETGERIAKESFPDKESAESFALNRTAGLGLSKEQFQVNRGLLHDIAEELTGSSGEKVEFGPHNKAGAKVFKNPDGTPKETSTGFVYDIKSAKENFSLYGGDKPTEKRWQERSTSESQSPDVELATKYIASPIPFIRSQLDEIASKHGSAGQYVANKFKSVGDERTHLIGQITNGLLEPIRSLYKNPMDWIRGGNESINRVYQYMQDIRDNKNHTSDIELTSEEQDAYDTIRAKLVEVHDMQRENGPLVLAIDPKTGKSTYRQPLDDPYYVPHIMDTKVADMLTRRPTSIEARALRRQFIEYKMQQEGMTEKVAKESLERMFPNKSGIISTDYNAVRLQESSGLPISWREKNFANVLRRYGNRFATDLAFYRNVQTDPAMRRLLDIKDDGQGNVGEDVELADTLNGGEDISDVRLDYDPTVQSIMRDLTHMQTSEDATINSMNRLVKAGMMQTPTGLRDVITAVPIAMKHMQFKELPKILTAVSKLSSGVSAGIKEGVIKYDAASLQDIGDIMSGGDATGVFNEAAVMLNKVTGREFLETISRGITMQLGRELAEGRLSRALDGSDKEAVKFFDDFGPQDWKTNKDHNSVIDWSAARFTEANQGTYDFRGQPTLTLQGQVSPFFSLAKWNIEQFNNFERFVIRPAKEGNLRPLLMSLFGVFLGGEAITEFNELLTGRKPPELTWSEWLNLEGEDSLYKLFALAANSGVSGIFADIGKTTLDLSRGNKPRGFTFPLVDAVFTSADRVGQALKATQDGEISMGDALGKLSLTLATDNIQLARLMKVLAAQEDVSRVNDLRDLRLFRQIEGKKVSSIGSSDLNNPFEQPDIKEFKRETDPQVAIETQLPKIMERLQRQFGNDPEELQTKWRALKQNSYQTVPNPENLPAEFTKYYKYLIKTQGKQAADKRIDNYFKQNAVNQMKATAIP